MDCLPRPVMIRIWSQPEAMASSTPYWMIGLSTRGSISLGWALVAGRKRVPSPAAGNTAFRIFIMAAVMLPHGSGSDRPACYPRRPMLDLKLVVENKERVLAALASRGQSLQQIQAWPGLESVDPWMLDGQRRAAI